MPSPLATPVIVQLEGLKAIINLFQQQLYPKDLLLAAYVRFLLACSPNTTYGMACVAQDISSIQFMFGEIARSLEPLVWMPPITAALSAVLLC